MSDDALGNTLVDRLADLLALSVAAWAGSGQHGAGAAAAVRADGDEIMVTTADGVATVARAPAGMPFRWVVRFEGRTRTAQSVAGVLRIVRQHIAPDYVALRLNVAPPQVTGQ